MMIKDGKRKKMNERIRTCILSANTFGFAGCLMRGCIG